MTLKPTGHTLHIRYLFASEEYPEYVGSDYDDVMGVFVNGNNCAHAPGTTDRISVNSINDDTNSSTSSTTPMGLRATPQAWMA